ncbi:hypothetical protein RHMOL_Rhmol05G0162500 [Rhododendron molle]|uniref:Uncharacterized protein n=1 Tax=Rhododendron molle TaxID=49168 RepID=A0ACC0NPI7_RHOML|nr:hypothetical protein RHMOL_Rhmol05G0162500 [Rhododendron molle]
MRSQARGASEERRATTERQREGEGHVRQSLSGPVVLVEWVNEAVRCVLAMENVIRTAASGMPLELHYPAPTPPPAQPPVVPRAQAQGRAALKKKSARDLPHKKIETRSLTTSATS